MSTDYCNGANDVIKPCNQKRHCPSNNADIRIEDVLTYP